MARRLERPPAAPGAAPPHRERLTRDRVVAAALALVDRDGLEALTMRRLGRELGVDPMAAYHWFPSKQAILQGVGEAILAEVRLPEIAADAPWPDVLRAAARAYRAALLRHPQALTVAATQPVLTPRGLDLVERILTALTAGGLAPGVALEAINTAAALVVGLALAEAGVTPGAAPSDRAQIEAAYAALDPSRFPATVAAIGEAMALMGDDEARFERACEALVRGFAAREGAARPTDATAATPPAPDRMKEDR